MGIFSRSTAVVKSAFRKVRRSTRRSTAKVKIAVRQVKTDAHEKEISRQNSLAKKEQDKAAALDKSVAVKENKRAKAARDASELDEVRARVAAAQDRQAKAKAMLQAKGKSLKPNTGEITVIDGATRLGKAIWHFGDKSPRVTRKTRTRKTKIKLLAKPVRLKVSRGTVLTRRKDVAGRTRRRKR
jgi:transglutaminase/protease-like cytokinesis protein 3